MPRSPLLVPALVAFLVLAPLVPAAEDPWTALLRGHLGALPAEAEVGRQVVPLAAALDALRGMDPGSPGRAAAGGTAAGGQGAGDAGYGVRAGSSPCDVGVMVAAIKRGRGPVQELFVNERVASPAPLPGGVVACGTGFAWAVGTGSVEVANAPDLFTACVNPAAGAWLGEGSHCHAMDFAAASVTGRVGFAEFTVRAGDAWVRIERMFGGVHGWAPGPGQAQADAAAVQVQG